MVTDPKERQELYSRTCKDLNALVLSQNTHLNTNLHIGDTFMSPSSASARTEPIKARLYHTENNDGRPSLERVVMYFHGGGLYVGDLDSEDLTCRRLALESPCTVFSIDYRLLPEFTADQALEDCVGAFYKHSLSLLPPRKVVIMGSSSGGELAAQVAQHFFSSFKLQGVLLRGPVTCDATSNGINLPPQFKDAHTSMSEAFHTSILSGAALNAENRSKAKLPLEASQDELKRLPKHWIQVCTNDIYYSDGMLYAEALRMAGVDVRLDVLEGWPHTFWLKAPLLEGAEKAERDMIEGCKWLFED